VEEAAKPIRVAICGEVNSGKSTLVNALLKGRVLPDLFGKKTRPYIHIRPGETARPMARLRDGTETELEALNAEDLADAEACELTQAVDYLDGLEIIEAPFLNERDITDEQIAFVESADILVWVTIASQAWRLSEKTILDRCEKRPKAAVLVISRADKLRSDTDREKLMGRMERETGDYFKTIVMMHGKDTLIEAAAQDDDVWETVGAPKLLDHLHRLADEVRQQQHAALAAVQALSEDAIEDEAPEEEITAAEDIPEKEASESAEIVVIDPSKPPSRLQVAMAKAKDEPEPQPVGETAVQAEVAAVAETPKISDAARQQLSALLPALHGCLAVGLAPLSDSEAETEFLKGEGEDWPEMGAVCRSMHQADMQLDPGTGGAGLQSHLTLSSHQLITQSFPKRGVALFMLTPTARMNHGIARTAFARLSRAVEQSR